MVAEATASQPARGAESGACQTGGTGALRQRHKLTVFRSQFVVLKFSVSFFARKKEVIVVSTTMVGKVMKNIYRSKIEVIF